LCLIEKEVDGETLELLRDTGAPMDQLAMCGFKAIKHQLKIKKLLLSTPASSVPALPPPELEAKLQRRPSNLKLSREEIKNLSPEDKHVYLIKYV